MNQILRDRWLLSGIVLSHLLLFITFSNKTAVFWFLYTAAMLFLISYSILFEKVDDEMSAKSFLGYGIISGVALYGVFWVGYLLITIIPGPLKAQVASVYTKLSPELYWHYIVLILILVPGEEIFWRGFIQKRFMRYTTPFKGVMIASVLNASVFIYSGSTILVIAALFSGVVWGLLYVWKKSMPLLIVSHLIFNMLLVVVLPFA